MSGRLGGNDMIKIAPSVLSADILNMERDVNKMLEGGADWIHVDIMDAHFVPNLSYGPSLVEALHKRYPEVPLDVHLMMDNPQYYIDRFARSGASVLTIHAELHADISDTLRRIRARGMMSSIALRPGTPAESIRGYLPLLDMVLVMTVEPGFGGQPFNAGMATKVAEIRKMGYTGLIEVDGGVSVKNLPYLRELGVDVAVMGNSLFTSEDPLGDMEKIHQM